MVATQYKDTAIQVRCIEARTDAAGTAVLDYSGEEDRFANVLLTEGFLKPSNSMVVQPEGGTMGVVVGSGGALSDLYAVEGDLARMGVYICRLEAASFTITLDASDAEDRIDEIWLVIADMTYDPGTVSLPRFAVRKGDPSASPTNPGPDPSWEAAAKLADVVVPGGATSIVAGNITDTRVNAQLADWVRSPLMNSLEVDGSVEVASTTLPTSSTVLASLNLQIPEEWNSWKCEAYGTFSYEDQGNPTSVDFWVSIDGVGQQKQNVETSGNNLNESGAVGGRRTGMTTTGPRTVELRGQAGSSELLMRDIYLYARAVRVS